MNTNCTARCLLLWYLLPVKIRKYYLQMHFCFFFFFHKRSVDHVGFTLQQAWCSVWLIHWNDLKRTSATAPFLFVFISFFFFFFCHWLAGYFCRLLRENERTGRWMNTWYWYPLLKCQRAVRFALHGEATAGSSDQGSAACNQCSENHNQTTTCLTTHAGPVIAFVVIVCFIQLPVLNRVHRGSCWPRIKKQM